MKGGVVVSGLLNRCQVITLTSWYSSLRTLPCIAILDHCTAIVATSDRFRGDQSIACAVPTRRPSPDYNASPGTRRRLSLLFSALQSPRFDFFIPQPFLNLNLHWIYEIWKTPWFNIPISEPSTNLLWPLTDRRVESTDSTTRLQHTRLATPLTAPRRSRRTPNKPTLWSSSN